MVKAGCLSEQETKYVTNSDPAVPGIDSYDGGNDHYPGETELLLGSTIYNITPTINQLSSGDDAAPEYRLGDEVTMLRYTGRFQIHPYNEMSNESNDRVFDPSLCEMRIHYIKVKKNATISATKVNRALKNTRPGSLPIDSKLDVNKEFRKQFTILETIKLMPKYSKSQNAIVYPAVYGFDKVDSSQGDQGEDVPVLIDSQSGNTTILGTHADSRVTHCTWFGRESSFILSHNFKAQKMIFDGSSPRDYDYYLVFQLGDWTWSNRNSAQRFAKWPRMKLWNTYTFKDA